MVYSFRDSLDCLHLWIDNGIPGRTDIIHQARFGNDDLSPDALAAQLLFPQQTVKAVFADLKRLCGLYGGQNVRIVLKHDRTPLKRASGKIAG